MISNTLENILILTVFHLLISGLILCSSGALLFQREVPVDRQALKLLSSAFFLYSLHLLLLSVFSYRSLSLPTPTGPPASWKLLIEATESAALVLLGFSYLFHLFPARRRNLFWPMAGILWILLVSSSFPAAAAWTQAFSPFRLSALGKGGWLIGVALIQVRRSGQKGFLSVIALFALGMAQMLRAYSPGPNEGTWMWGLENVCLVAGLVLFAIVVDKQSTFLPVHFFLRLNLIFVALATLLILMDAQLQRREHLRIAESQTVELSEFLRAHVIQFYDPAREPREVLSNHEIIRKITSDFGRLPDLRRVRVFLAGWEMEMSIAEDWVVTHEIFREEGRVQPTDSSDDWGRMGTLSPVPIIYKGKPLGRIELDENLQTINEQVSRHMRLVFLTFTVAVFVAAALFGFTVHRAHSTIQRQFRELENTHAQLAHVERLASVGQLAGGVAHEINNPAGIILTTSDYVLRESEKQGLPDSLREDILVIRRQARRVSEIVNGLLTFSRPAVLHKQATDVNKSLQQSVLLLAPRFREQKVELEQKLMPGLPLVSADSDRLEQVFVNLLNNAGDALQNGGRIRVETGVNHTKRITAIVVSIADNGSGISPEHLKKIFDPFFSTKPRGRGTGLGLSVSHGIIRDHGGRIEVDSQLGRGTVFHIYLPLMEERREEV